MAEDAVVAAQAELDQAEAALAEAAAAHASVFGEAQALDEERAKAAADFKDRSGKIGERLEPLSLAVEKAEGDVRRAQARVEALGEYEEPPAQGIGGE